MNALRKSVYSGMTNRLSGMISAGPKNEFRDQCDVDKSFQTAKRPISSTGNPSVEVELLEDFKNIAQIRPRNLL